MPACITTGTEASSSIPEHDYRAGRRRFTWSGKNSDLERRRGAKRLYQELMQLEREGRAYHLVGHSHGGTVIWHALELAARGDARPGLRSCTTLGAPFPTFRPDTGACAS